MRNLPPTVTAAGELGTDVATGLSLAAAVESRARHGENRLPEVKPRSIFAMFVSSLEDKTLIILMAAAALAIGVEVVEGWLDPSHSPHYVDGIAILAAVVIASFVTTLNEARAAKEFRLLSRARDDVAIKVLREGHVRPISIYEIVVGDIVYFDTGDKFPADGLLLAGVDVTVDQSMLTGESVAVDKDIADTELKGGTTVTRGNGTMLVTHVGKESEIGRLHATLATPDDDPTPLQERLAWLADRIGTVGLAAAILTFLALSVSAFARGELPFAWNLEVGARLLDFSIIAVTIVVVSVPEGLPLAVTISLAYSVQRMAKDKNLVRRLASCETMGAATVVCSDKTGTLTMNRMSVVAGWIAETLHEAPPNASSVAAPIAARIAEIASVNATAFLEDDGALVRYVGNPTECALLAWVAGWGKDWRALRKNASPVHQLGFTSDRKRMSTLVPTNGGTHRLLVKGAPEVLLELSRDLACKDGSTRAIAPADRTAVLAAIERFSEAGHRTLALAHRELGADAEASDPSSLERDLVFLGVVAIADPVRPEVRGAVDACRAAGVDVKMVTGDNLITARSIASQIGLLGEGDLILEGNEFRAHSDAELIAKLPMLRVLARSVPSDKHRLVTLLKERGEVVAVTGDGTNDAPALHAADVGFSMGLSGSEVAKEASDIVLLDDNFASIVGGIQWGRSIFANIRKFLQFQLTVNVVALSTAFFAAVLGLGVPLNAVQLLWVNLIMDTLAALALATEPPSPDLLRHPPHGRHAPLITRTMWTNIFVMGGIMFAILMSTMWTDWFVAKEAPHAVRLTFVFNAFVFMQLFNEINARSTRFDGSVVDGLFRSRLFLIVLVVTAGAQILIIELGGEIFRTTPLDLDAWVRSVLLGASTLVAGAILRSVGTRLPKRWFLETEARPAGTLANPGAIARGKLR